MKIKFSTDFVLKILCVLLLGLALVQSFTVSDYYIFNRFGEFNAAFIISQWIKKAGLLLLPLAVFFKKKGCADAAKYLLPVFVIISLFTFGSFFDITMLTDDATPAQKVYASINEFISAEWNAFMFFISAELYLAICALLFVRDGFKINLKSLIYAPLSVLAVMPLNIFENFYDVNAPEFGPDSFWWFKNFTIWHFLMLAILVGATVGAYYFLKNKPRERQNDYLVALAIVMLIHYHSKDSVVMGDGYNVYYTVFACIPLFICNIGVYMAALSVFFKKRVLYSIAFFVHAVGALSVFIYFGRDEMSNYGIFCGYSILFFCLTHCTLFMLSVLPSALGHYRFKPKDAVIPLAYYCVVIITAAVAGALVTSASMGFTYDGYTLAENEWLHPNYAFTQVNPLPIPEPELFVRIWRYDMNIAYVIILYLVYVGLFYAFNGAYYLFNLIRKKILHTRAKVQTASADAPALSEAAATDEDEK